MAYKMYALVRWASGIDKDKMSVIKSSWVKDIENWEGGDKETYITEWRESKSKPVGGWKCYDSIVINTSDSKSDLEKELSSLSISKKKESFLAKLPELSKVIESDVDDSDEDPHYVPDEDSTKDVDHKSKRKQEGKNIPKLKNSARGSEMTPHLQQYLEREFQKLHAKLDSLAEKITSRGSRREPASEPSSEPAASSDSKLELYPGTGVFVDEVAWISANSSQSPGSFISSLLVNLFPEEVLLRSNLKGGKNKNDPSLERKEALDPLKIQALRLAAQKKYPGLTAGRFGAYVNNKLGNLRHKSRLV